MKLTKTEQAELDRIRDICSRWGTVGCGSMERGGDRTDRTRMRLHKKSAVLYVGVGEKTSMGFAGGAGLIPADVYVETKHTVLELGQSLDWGRADRAARDAAPELLETLKELLTYANSYSDKMREIGRGAEQLGEGADSVSVAGRARALIDRVEGAK